MPQSSPNSKTVITGERVVLRPPRKKDGREFLAVNRRSASFNRGLASPPAQPAEFEAFLKRHKRPDAACFLICLKEDGAIMGSIALSQIFRGGFLSAYLGYQIGAEFARQGYMTEAIQLMLRHAFVDLKLHRLEANIQPGNVASIALVKRAGFVREGYSRRYLKICGRWRDHERWAILVEDWRKQRKTA
jgi:[ribosomal protein S5]-alanine N-acetyltransferase